MTVSKFMGSMAGACVILLLILVLYFLRWDGSAEEDEKRVLQNLKAWEQLWAKTAPDFAITYDEMAVRGFPFSTKINLMRPQITAHMPDGKVVFSTAFLSFAPFKDKDYGYSLEFLADIVVMFYPADGSDPQSYMLHLSQVPAVRVQALPVQGRPANGINGWNVVMPERLVANVLHADKSAQINFNFTPMGENQWLGIPVQIQPYVHALFNFIREAVAAKP